MSEKEFDPQVGFSLHARMLVNDPLASAEIAELFLPWLCHRLKQLNPAVRDDNMLDSAAIDGIRAYLRNPKRYNPAKLSLHKYLLMSAGGDLRNALQQKGRAIQRDTEIAKNIVELHLHSSEQTVNAIELERMVQPFLEDSVDRKIFSLIAAGVHSTEEHAIVLGITQQPLEQRRRIVKATKDRILARLRRAAKVRRLKREDTSD
jgi:hypothetical protein